MEVVDQGKAAGLGQDPVNRGPGILEQCNAELCRYGLPGYLRRLDEVEVGVARSRLVVVGDLSFHPEVFGEEFVQSVLHQGTKGAYGQDGQVSSRGVDQAGR